MKIDTSKIEGYEELSAEEKLAILEGYEIDVPEPDYSGYIKKDTFDKTASELASYKRQLKERMSEDEIAKAEEAKAREELQAKYDELLNRTMVSDNKAKLLELGYESSLAEKTAQAMVAGDLDTVIANQQKHLTSVEKKIKAELLKQTPSPVGDGESNTMTLENFRKLSTEDRLKFSQEHPEEYREMYQTGGTE